MIPFRLIFRPGASLYEQVVYAARKAIVSGEMRPGDPFPSVRVLSRELKINPNTAHKATLHLTNEGLLEIRSGIGAVVAPLPKATAAAKAGLLSGELEALIVEAKKLGLRLEDVVDAVHTQWRRIGPATEAKGSAKTE